MLQHWYFETVSPAAGLVDGVLLHRRACAAEVGSAGKEGARRLLRQCALHCCCWEGPWVAVAGMQLDEVTEGEAAMSVLLLVLLHWTRMHGHGQWLWHHRTCDAAAAVSMSASDPLPSPLQHEFHLACVCC